MIIEAIATGKTLSEAQEKAVAQLGNVNLDNAECAVISMPKAKVLGLFVGSEANVRDLVEVEDKKALPITIRYIFLYNTSNSPERVIL